MTSNLKSLRPAALVATIALAFQALLMLLGALLAARSLTLDRTRDEDVDRLYDLYDLVGVVLYVPSILGYVVAATAVIVWLWRARANAEIIDASPFVHDGAAQR
ncbi:hypothetical protein ACFQ07_26470, partial [Actinomadura adrarensis]